MRQIQSNQISPRTLSQGKGKGMTSLHWLRHGWKEAIEGRGFDKWNQWHRIDPRRHSHARVETSSTTELALQIIGKIRDHSVVGVREIRCTCGKRIGYLPHTIYNNQWSMQRKASKPLVENIGEYWCDLNVGKNKQRTKVQVMKESFVRLRAIKIKKSCLSKCGRMNVKDKLQSGKRNLQNI